MTEATLSPEFLARMDEAIAEEFERSSRLRKILPAEVDMPHARYGVTIPRVVDDAGTASASAMTDVLRPPITLSREVKIAARQLEDLDLVSSLVRDATKRVCVVEDQVIAYGGLLYGADETRTHLLQGVRFAGLRGTTEGLMGPGTALRPAFSSPLVDVDPDNPNKKPKRGKTLRAIIQQAVANLDRSTPPFAAPYAAALGPQAWSDYVPADEDYDKGAIAAALQSEKIAVVSGPPLRAGFDSGLEPPAIGDDENPRDIVRKLEADAFLSVFSSDPVDLDLVRVRRPWGSARGYDEDGNLRFVIEDQFLLRVKRPEAIYAVWLTDRDGDRVAEVQNLPIEVAD